MNTKRLLLFILLVFSVTSFGQSGLFGVVTDEAQQPLPGATVRISNSNYGAVTDMEGNYELSVPAGTYQVEVSFVGYDVIKQSVSLLDGQRQEVNFEFASSSTLDQVVVIGSRAEPRTLLNSPSPVDIVDYEQRLVNAPQTNINQQLQYSIPSFSANTQSITDGTDHIDPASLRGLGPDQVLVLINGKRRHNTSLINLNSAFGRGSVGTDMNSLPGAAVDRIEVLRDGASAQYGSDAIAGVVNIILKENYDQLRANVTTSGFWGKGANDRTGGIDGEEVNIDLNYGIGLGQNGGVINFTGAFNDRDYTNRMKQWEGSIFNAYNAIENVAQSNGLDLANLSVEDIQNQAQNVSYFTDEFKAQIQNATNVGMLRDLLSNDVTDQELGARGLERSDFNMRVGQSALRSGQFFTNMTLPLGEHSELYAFGGISKRNGESAGFYRMPNQDRTYTPVYINGFLPEIKSDIADKSLAAGIKGKIQEWDVDFSNTVGQNQFKFIIDNSSNATLQESTPFRFEAGGYSFLQNTTNLDFSQYFENTLNGLNIAFGAEGRFENYKINAGAPNSYTTYDIYGEPDSFTTPANLVVRDFFGSPRPGGSQVFPGFRPENEVDNNRSSVAAYGDVEANFTEAFLMSGALRFENYSDFGSTLNGKISTRYKVGDNASLRGTFSTGFRAPSLHQINYSSTATQFVDGIPYEIGTFSNTSRAAKVIGIDPLKEENSYSGSAGFTMRSKDKRFSFTADGYYTKIKDRVVLTGNFTPSTPELEQIFNNLNIQRARFFANAINTETYGVDFIMGYDVPLKDEWLLTNNLSGTFARTKLGKVNAGSGLLQGQEDIFFGPVDQGYLEKATPNSKVILTNNFSGNKMNVFLANTWFGEVTNPSSNPDNRQVYKSKIVTDLTFGYKFSDMMELTVGANNLFDVYPDKNIDALRSSGRFDYPRAVTQFGFAGRKALARLSLNIR